MHAQYWWGNRLETIHLEDRKKLEDNCKTIPMEAKSDSERLTKLSEDRGFSCYVKSSGYATTFFVS
jgi:hypothetical protein